MKKKKSDSTYPSCKKAFLSLVVTKTTACSEPQEVELCFVINLTLTRATMWRASHRFLQTCPLSIQIENSIRLLKWSSGMMLMLLPAVRRTSKSGLIISFMNYVMKLNKDCSEVSGTGSEECVCTVEQLAESVMSVKQLIFMLITASCKDIYSSYCCWIGHAHRRHKFSAERHVSGDACVEAQDNESGWFWVREH